MSVKKIKTKILILSKYDFYATGAVYLITGEVKFIKIVKRNIKNNYIILLQFLRLFLILVLCHCNNYAKIQNKIVLLKSYCIKKCIAGKLFLV